VKTGTRFSKIREIDLLFRPVVQTSLGPHIWNAAMPHPCPHDARTLIKGSSKRFLVKPPTPIPGIINNLRAYVRKYVRKHYRPLAAHADTSIEAWLDKVPYSAARKAELLEKWNKCLSITDPEKRYFECKLFMKDECYPEYKHARGINSRTDEFKCAVGPIFKLIEESVFSDKHFIKKIPTHLRPKYIMDYLYQAAGVYCSTDYTAFEANFTAELMSACEFELYRHMTSELPSGAIFIQLLEDSLLKTNTCVNKNFTVEVPGTRMSGEMNTSLGNSFSNLMFMKFICKLKGCTKVKGVVEGDDGLFTMVGTPPTQNDFAKLGLMIKIEYHTDIATASFCGIIFDPLDLVNVTDPIELLCSLGWSTRQYARCRRSKRMALLRCKALSYAHQYPGCPLVSSLSHMILRQTRPYAQAARDIVFKAQHMNMYWKEEMIAAFKDENKIVKKPTGINTRLLVEQRYNIPVKHQMKIEEYFDNCNDLSPLRNDYIDMHVPELWKTHFAKYSVFRSLRDPDLEHPGHLFASAA